MSNSRLYTYIKDINKDSKDEYSNCIIEDYTIELYSNEIKNKHEFDLEGLEELKQSERQEIIVHNDSFMWPGIVPDSFFEDDPIYFGISDPSDRKTISNYYEKILLEFSQDISENVVKLISEFL
jgi:hypothetical protein